MNTLHTIKTLLVELYGDDQGEALMHEVDERITSFRTADAQKRKEGFDQSDSILITYADQFQEQGSSPLHELKKFSDRNIKDIISSIHILPFYPFSSDDGFSVIDYQEVNEEFGSWDDIESLSDNFRLMFDYVGNHMSSKSEWFRKFCEGDPEYDDFFITVDPDIDLSQVVRPRDLPLKHKFNTNKGEKWVWTTFSGDQIDLNYANPKVFLKMIDVLFDYVNHGASIIRLDAVQFTWKEIGTPCIHHPKTHMYVQLMHALLDAAAPGVQLITETAVPHIHNISYFGNGCNESQMVYNFTLPPLLLYSFVKENTEKLSEWASGLEYISPQATYFNLLACHDGVGVNAIRGIVSEEEVVWLASKMEERGGYVSNFMKPDGSSAPYELNISYINGLSRADDTVEMKSRKMLNAFALAFSLMGVPGIYVHSLLGSENWREGAENSGIKRRINRQKFIRASVEQEIHTEGSLRSTVFKGMTELLLLRQRLHALHPDASQKILSIDSQIMAVHRENPENNEILVSIHNVSSLEKRMPLEMIGCTKNSTQLIAGEGYIESDEFVLPPFAFGWITKGIEK